MNKKSDSFENVKASARKIWLAGMGALSQAEKEGDKLFQSLVKKGREYEGVIKENAEAAGDAVRESVTAARKEAGRGMEKMESIFDAQVAAAKDRLGIASRKEVESLRSEVERLRARLAGKKKTATARTAPAGRKRAASKKKKKKSTTTAANRKKVAKATRKAAGKKKS